MMQAASFLLEDVLKDDSRNYLALVDAASIRMGSQRLKEAGDLLRRAQELYPADGEIYHLMGHAMINNAVMTGKLENLESARRLFETAVRLAPMNEEALYDLACATAQQDQELALNYLERAVESGFRDYRHMATDRDLDPIRDNPRFRQITGGNVPAPTASPAAPPGAGAAPAQP